MGKFRGTVPRFASGQVGLGPESETKSTDDGTRACLTLLASDQTLALQLDKHTPTWNSETSLTYATRKWGLGMKVVARFQNFSETKFNVRARFALHLLNVRDKMLSSGSMREQSRVKMFL